MIFKKPAKKIFFSLFTFCFGVFPLGANFQIQQKVLDGTAIPKFVESLPIPNRVDGRKPLKICAKEFQQRILPDKFYENLPESITYKSVETGEPLFSINPRKGTYVWGYEIHDGKKIYGPSYPADTIEAQRGVKTKVTYKNCLFPFKDEKGGELAGPLLQKFLTIDVSFDWANPLKWPRFGQGFDTYDPLIYPYGTGMPQGNPGIYNGPHPTVVHLHGGEVASFSDGTPTSWFTPHKKFKGYSYVTNQYVYPNKQPATTLWFHDHTLGITRLNVYAGLAGFYILRGNPDKSVSPPLPDRLYEIEMAIQDRQFDIYGQPFFPDGNPLTAGLNGPPENAEMNAYAIPEFFGDVMCVNGRSWPYLEVEPRRYRFRLLNACNARMLALYLTSEDPLKPSVPSIWQIGTDGGLLDRPVDIGSFIPYSYNPSDECFPQDPDEGPVFQFPRLFFAPGERMDIIIDFAGFEGQTFTWNNDGPTPFPSGGALLDPKVEGLILQFRVKKRLSSVDESFNPALPGARLRKRDQAMVRLADCAGNLAPGVIPNLTRSLVLIEQEGPFTQAPLMVLCNNTTYSGRSLYSKTAVPDSVPYHKGKSHVTEIPQVGSTEIWEIVNLTADAHPIHLHLIEFQILNRQAFYVGSTAPPFACAGSYRSLYENTWNNYVRRPFDVPPGTIYSYGPPLNYLETPKLGGNPDVSPFLIGEPFPCDPNECGWKDTVKVHPGTVTRLVVRWSPQDIPVGEVLPGENRFPFDPTTKLGIKKERLNNKGSSLDCPGYVWHCHILDHEDNEMMRPFQLSYESQR